MPKTAGIPKSLLADLNRVKTRLASLEKEHSSMLKTRLASLEKAQASFTKEFKDSTKTLNDMLKKQQDSILQMGKKPAKKAKRKPSQYNLFLKEKMSAGMNMIDAVKAWKAKEAGMSSSSSSSPTRDTGQDWQSPSQQY
jgi:hypothetical protein